MCYSGLSLQGHRRSFIRRYRGSLVKPANIDLLQISVFYCENHNIQIPGVAVLFWKSNAKPAPTADPVCAGIRWCNPFHAAGARHSHAAHTVTFDLRLTHFLFSCAAEKKRDVGVRHTSSLLHCQSSRNNLINFSFTHTETLAHTFSSNRLNSTVGFLAASKRPNSPRLLLLTLMHSAADISLSRLQVTA